MDGKNNNNLLINNNNDIRLSKFINIIEKLFQDNLYNNKFIFFEKLLNYWYNINQKIFSEKIEEINNINAIYNYNIYKHLIYKIENLLNNNRLKFYLKFFNSFKLLYISKKKLFIVITKIERKKKIKRIYYNIFLDKITNYIKYKNLLDTISLPFTYESKKYESNIKSKFYNELIEKNIDILNSQRKCDCYCIDKNYNQKNKSIYNLILSFFKWQNISVNKFLFNEDLIYKENIMIIYFKTNSLIIILKMRIKFFFRLFIFKCKANYYLPPKKYLIQKSNTNKIFANILFLTINKLILNPKKEAFDSIFCFSYTTKNILIFTKILFNIINLFIKKQKTYVYQTLMQINKNPNFTNQYIINVKYIFALLSKLFSFKKKILQIFFLNSLGKYRKRNKQQNQLYYPSISYYLNKKFKKNMNTFNFNSNKEITNLIKILFIYQKNNNLMNFSKNQRIHLYFDLWANLSRKKLIEESKYLITNISNIKSKIDKYTDKNNIIKNEIQKKDNINDNFVMCTDSLEEPRINTIQVDDSLDFGSINKIKKKDDNNIIEEIEKLKSESESVILKLQLEINCLVQEIEQMTDNL